MSEHSDKVERIYAALLELVECKDLKDTLDDSRESLGVAGLTEAHIEQMRADYMRRKPLAWEKARKAAEIIEELERELAGLRAMYEAEYRLHTDAEQRWLAAEEKLKSASSATKRKAVPAATVEKDGWTLDFKFLEEICDAASLKDEGWRVMPEAAEAVICALADMGYLDIADRTLPEAERKLSAEERSDALNQLSGPGIFKT